VNSTEFTPRVGLRFHFLSRDLPTAIRGRERAPSRRIVVRDLVRVDTLDARFPSTRPATPDARFPGTWEQGFSPARERSHQSIQRLPFAAGARPAAAFSC
jgi:hypothetical protein